MPLLEAGLNLLSAVGLGAAIGFERQWRQRLAPMSERVEVTATVTSHKLREIALETIISRLAKEDGVTRAGVGDH